MITASQPFRTVTYQYPAFNSQTVPSILNAWDVNTPADPNGAAWSPGGIMIDQAAVLVPPLTASYQATSFSVSAQLALISEPASAFPPSVYPSIFGKLGRIWAGLTTQGQTGPGAGLIAGNIPSDSTTFTLLYDPAANPLPPYYSVGNFSQVWGFYEWLAAIPTFLPVSCSLQLPNALEVDPGLPFGVALYVEPALLGFPNGTDLSRGGIAITQAQWALEYETVAGSKL